MPCTTILVGKGATQDSSTIIARNNDGGFEAKQILVLNEKTIKNPYRSVISHVTVPLPKDPIPCTIAPSVDRKNGIWAACGINRENVAMTATETITTNPSILAADPFVVYQAKTKQKKEVIGGIGEEDLVMLVLPYIRTAREGVERLGGLLEVYGTYESNGIAFSDASEIWYLETIGGHHWIAKRVEDNQVVIMPNQFGIDSFDFQDAYGKKKSNMCSKDLQDFLEEHHLDHFANEFNPRHVFGSHRDADHIYNTPRAWFMARYLTDDYNSFDIQNCAFTPESNDIPWSLTPVRSITIEDVKYMLSSHYQGTPYNPYSHTPEAGKYRSIGVPNSDVSGILQIRGYMPKELQGVEWLSMGGSGFTACFPLYTYVSKLPSYVSGTKTTVSTDHMYWTSRLIAALCDAHHDTALILDERYQYKVLCETSRILHEADRRLAKLHRIDPQELEKVNQELVDFLQKESETALLSLLDNAGEHMKTRYHRNDQ